MFGPGSHSARLGGTLPLQKGQRREAQQKEGKGQEEQEEIGTRAQNYLNKIF